MASGKGSKKSTKSAKTAAAKVSSSSGRKTSGAKSSQKEQKNADVREDRLMRDVQLLVVLAVCILLFLSNLGLGGTVGHMVASVFFGLFGLPTYVFPVMFFYFVLLVMAEGDAGETARRIIGLTGLYIFLCALFQLILFGYREKIRVLTLYSDSSLDQTGGGLFGGLIVQLAGAAFGTAGAYVIIFIGLIIFAIFLTQKPLLSLLQEKGEEAYDTRDERRAARQERRLQRQEARAEAAARREEEMLRREEERARREEEREAAREQAAIASQGERALLEDHGSADLQEVSEGTRQLQAAADGGILPVTASGVEETDDSELSRRRRNRRSGRAEDPDGGHAFQTFDLSSEMPGGMGPVMKKSSEEAAAKKDMASDKQKLSILPKDMEPEITGIGIDDALMPPKTEGHDNFDDSYEPEYLESFDEDDEEIVSAEELASGAAPIRPARRSRGKAESSAAEAVSEEPSAAGPAKESKEARPARRGKPSVGEVEEIVVPEEEEEPYVYQFPPIDLLNPPDPTRSGDSREHLKDTAAKLQMTLHNFGVEVTINHISCGPTVTRYELTPQMGVKVSKILSLQDDIKLNLAASDIRIEAPIPGKSAIGIEVPNKTNTAVPLRELLESQAFINHKSKLAFAVGKDIGGQVVVTDIAKMPHLLIAGATGSGKSVCINTLIMSILYKAAPDEVRFIMIDPKVVELSVYNGIPHLLIPVVTDPKKAAGALNWAVAEMTDRYQRFAEVGARDMLSYNARIADMPEPENGERPKKMSRIVVIVDELADLMMVAQNEVEDAIVRLAQLARAAGIHLIIATQRPSVNVITGLIKANMPSRIALAVTSGVDSRTILDMVGAEKLLGKGDMLFYPQGYPKPARVQGAYLSDDEIAEVVSFLKGTIKTSHFSEESNEIQSRINSHSLGSESPSGDAMDTDEYFTDAAKLIIEKDKASIGMLQRAFRIGFNRAARIMDQLCDAGVVGEEEGTKPRKVLMTMEQFENYLEEN